MKNRIIELSANNREQVIELPVNPATVEFTEKQLNQAITLLNIGEANLKGERGLKYTKLSSFFPSVKSPFYKYAGKEPVQYISMLEEWKTSKAVVRLIITDMKINLAMLIDEMVYSMKEGDDDVYYTISLSEYRTLNVPAVHTVGVRTRPDPVSSTGGRTHTVVSGDTLWGISKQYYGAGAQCTKIYGANSGTIEASAKKHGRSGSDNGHWIYPGDVFVIP
ncbi:MAG: LysM peptidoglycan-binding domain-containing protein [Lachnospiraceae bacterium]|nr:LysM peptidoglycan-binding domain-containing protein [Lachnospiraceae bacterium]MCM1240971.1 LysM peptidoglycan-binding domain-containing protein [Lachnospiraceae bacterium]